MLAFWKIKFVILLVKVILMTLEPSHTFLRRAELKGENTVDDVITLVMLHVYNLWIRKPFQKRFQIRLLKLYLSTSIVAGYFRSILQLHHIHRS